MAYLKEQHELKQYKLLTNQSNYRLSEKGEAYRGEQTENNIRNMRDTPLECWYIPTTKNFLFISFLPISNVEVTIENLTTGELIQEEYPVIAGQVSIPAISTKGTFVIELIINDNEVYIGELKL